MPDKLPCESCNEPFLILLDQCPHCGEPALPHLRIASLPEERQALDERYADDGSTHRDQDASTDALDLFEEALPTTKVTREVLVGRFQDF